MLSVACEGGLEALGGCTGALGGDLQGVQAALAHTSQGRMMPTGARVPFSSGLNWPFYREVHSEWAPFGRAKAARSASPRPSTNRSKKGPRSERTPHRSGQF